MNGQKKLVKFFDCDCNREALRIEKDDDTGLFFFGFYEQPNPWSFWEKVKYCWKFMRTSHQFKDTLVFEPDKAKEIADWINEICSTNEGDES